jgi:polar amino acid transport system substrate-binding protein
MISRRHLVRVWSRLFADRTTLHDEEASTMRSVPALLLAALVLAGCQSLPGGSTTAAAATDARLPRILESGVLRVAVSPDRPPLILKNRSGATVGFDVDIVQALATAMGLELRLVEMPFAELIQSVRDGRADLAISGLTMTPERNARVAFAGPYFVSGMSVLARSHAITDVENPAALDRAERRYAAVTGSTSAKFIGDILPRAQLVAVGDYDTGIQMVIDGKADALFADHLVCSVAVWRHPDAGLSTLATPFTVEPFGIAVAPDAPLLLNLVQNYLATLDHAGLLAGYKAKWLADGRWIPETL